MINITATTFDVEGYIDFEPLPSQQSDTFQRRVSRVSTLDGGVAVSDRGYSDGDRTLVYAYRPISKGHDARAQRLIKLHPTVTVSTPDGVFKAVPQNFEQGPAENVFTLLVIERLDED